MNTFNIRMWNKKAKRLMMLLYINVRCETMTAYCKNDLNWASNYRFDQLTFMKCTELLDKNDQKIYEGDILMRYSSLYMTTEDLINLAEKFDKT